MTIMATKKTYSIFGAGASGLYTAWRLLEGKSSGGSWKSRQLAKGDTLELYDWGKYDFSKDQPGTRAPGARVCTWHYENDIDGSYLELGGMRYSGWNGDNGATAGGHRVVTTVIKQLGLDPDVVPFNVSPNPLFYLRTKNMYLAEITSRNPAPYNVNNYGADDSPDTGFTTVELLAGTESALPATRAAWCEFYRDGRIAVDLPESSAYRRGDRFTDIGYWNLMYDQLGSEGFSYVADGNGYTSNVINWNAAVALQANNEFTPGTEYKTLTTGYSGMFTALFARIVKLAKERGVRFEYHPNTRLHSILAREDGIHYAVATRERPNRKSATRTTGAAWLAMPRHALDLVAQATRYEEHDGLDVLNHQKVQLYLGSAIMQPSYKVGMFFDTEWWTDTSNSALQYPAPILAYEVTDRVLDELARGGFPKKYVNALRDDSTIVETSYSSTAEFLAAVEHSIQERLTIREQEQLLKAARRDTIGPSVTDMPIRQVVYFGNNARDQSRTPVYGLLASYDDEMYTSFWRDMEIGPNRAGGPAQGAAGDGEDAARAARERALRPAGGLHRRARAAGGQLHGLVAAALQRRLSRLGRALRRPRRAAEDPQAVAAHRGRRRRHLHRRRGLLERPGLGGGRVLHRRVRAERLLRNRADHRRHQLSVHLRRLTVSPRR